MKFADTLLFRNNLLLPEDMHSFFLVLLIGKQNLPRQNPDLDKIHQFKICLMLYYVIQNCNAIITLVNTQ